MRNKPVPTILSIALLLVVLISPPAISESNEGSTPELMTRIMMFPPNAEVTGMHIDANGHFFVNAMHPDNDNYRATIGVINGIDWNNLPSSIPELASSSSESDTWHGIRTSYGYYQVLQQDSDVFSEGGVAGGIYAADDGNRMFTSEKPDYNAFVPLNEDGSRGYLYTAWEDRPAGVSQLEIEWNTTSSEWEVLGGMMLDLSSVNGGWVFCFGSMSPWGTPLLSEELYFSDTQEWNDESYNYHSDQAELEDYLGYYPNPYNYGYIMEIENSTTTEPDFIKHFAMGRFSHENAQVMPDERTVYLSDDGYDTVLFKFVADTAGDLSSGTLYAAKVSQDDSSDSATTGFDVGWIEMASSSNSDIQIWIDEYDGITTADFISGQNSYITDEEIMDWAEGRLNEDLNGDGVIGSAADDRVAFLESRKAAAALGASDEWNKMEGVAFNPNAPDYLYLAMSDVSYDMSDGQGDIDVTQNRCGIVYRMTLDNGWDVNRIEPVISGGPYTSSATYECDVNNLAGPDNIVVLDDGRVLVGEDTGKHESNMVWLWGQIAEPEPEPEIDSDADGVVDSQDNCTDTPLGEMVDAEGCSETQLSGTVEDEAEAEDSDGDGYPDVTDLCDNTPNDSDERVYNVEANGCANMYAPYPEDCVNWEFWNSNNINTEEFGRGCPHFNQQSTQDYHDTRDIADTPQEWIIVFGLLVASIIVLFIVRRMREPEFDEGVVDDGYE
jgi:secreted PhoX family phosphatase